MYEEKNFSGPATPDASSSSSVVSPNHELRRMSDESQHMADMSPSSERAHLNKINRLSDLTINQDITDNELVNMYKETDVLEEHADILHYLFYNK